jgi:putative spermidine/putrescine transport system substrate-binding protein
MARQLCAAVRTVLTSVLAAAAVLAVGAHPAAAKDKLVVAVWGGVWGDSMDKNVFKPFAAANDVEIVVHSQRSAADTMTKIIAEKAKPTIDVYLTIPGSAYAVAKEGAAETMTPADVPELANFPKSMLGTMDGKVQWVNYGAQKIGLIFRTDIVKPPAKATLDWLADPSLKGKLAMPTPVWNYAAFLHQASMYKTGDMKKLDAGFDLAKKVAPNVQVIYGTTGEAVRLLSSGEVGVAYATATTSSVLLKENVPNVEFKLVDDAPLFVAPETVVVVKGGPAGKALAMKFANFFLSAPVLAAYGADIGTSSANAKSPAAPKEKVPFPMTAAELERAQISDLAANLDAINDRWKSQIAPLLGTK